MNPLKKNHLSGSPIKIRFQELPSKSWASLVIDTTHFFHWCGSLRKVEVLPKACRVKVAARVPFFSFSPPMVPKPGGWVMVRRPYCLVSVPASLTIPSLHHHLLFPSVPPSCLPHQHFTFILIRAFDFFFLHSFSFVFSDFTGTAAASTTTITTATSTNHSRFYTDIP